MCLVTEQKEPEILQEDLIVYKGFAKHDDSENLHAPYRDFKYVIGDEYRTAIKKEKGNLTTYDEEVDAAYGLSPGYTGISRKVQMERLTSISNGFHFFTTEERMESDPWVTVRAKCLIPKGSEVFFDKTGLGVANRIKILEVL